MKLKKGDMVWVKVPINAMIIRVNKKFGYTVRADNGDEHSYFGDDEVELLAQSERKK